MHNILNKVTIIICFCISVNCLHAQDVSALKNQKPVTFHGTIGGGVTFFTSNAEYKTQDPFSWNLYGNFTPTIYGLALPFSFVINQYSKSYSSPFTQFGISPSYKWIKLHLGYRNISYSPLVFDGQSFLGAGIELTPGKFYFSAFYGRLNKAVSEDTTYNHNLMPQYARHGYGFKIGYGSPDENFSIQYFHAKDDTASITRMYDSLTTILPQENTVLGSSWHFVFFKKLTFTGDLAVSLLNRDMYYQNIDSISYVKIPSIVNSINPINYSSAVSYSGQTQLVFVTNKFNASAGYKRVAPDFMSLGVPYSLNDQELISATAATNLVKGKVNVNVAFNTQHNNLEHMLSSELKTQNGNLGLNAFINQHLNMNINITGVKVYQEDGLLHLSDSVKMNQMMWNAVFSPVYTFSNTSQQHTVNLSINYTDLDDKNPATSSQASCNSLSTSLSYSLFFTQHYWGINANALYSNYNQPANKYSSLGLNAGVNAQFLKEHNLSMQGSMGYFVNHGENVSAGNNTTFSFNTNYEMKKHSLGLYASYVITPPVNLNPLNVVNHIPISVNSKNFSGGVTYAYHF